MKRFLMLAILSVIILISCEDDTYNYGYFPDVPENMNEFNSAFDDYNSYLLIIGDTGPLCYSSNRLSAGKDFDLVYKLLSVHMTKTSRKVRLLVSDYNEMYLESNDVPGNVKEAAARVTTGFNELGPYLVPQGKSIVNHHEALPGYDSYILLYASDESGNLDIQFTENSTDPDYSAPRKVSFCNSDADDAYPSIFPDSSSIFFCSDRGGDFDIYSVTLPGIGGFLYRLGSITQGEVKKVTELSSGNDDKCPFIAGHLLVFASDRPGGYGGFDLYYSLFNGTGWTAPVNFGRKINSAYDEYRPFVKNFGPDFHDDFMIFSSNRPGGKGGYDLYYVGIRKMSDI